MKSKFPFFFFTSCKITLTFSLTCYVWCEGSSEHIFFSLFVKVKICGAEVWSSEVEVKLIQGHGGELYSLTCGDKSPSLWPYLEMWSWHISEKVSLEVWEGRSGLEDHNTITVLFLTEMYKRAEVHSGCMSKIPLLAFSTTPLLLKSPGCPCYVAKRVRVLQ